MIQSENPKYHPMEQYVFICLRLAATYLALACLIVLAWEVYDRYLSSDGEIVSFGYSMNGDIDGTAVRIETKEEEKVTEGDS